MPFLRYFFLAWFVILGAGTALVLPVYLPIINALFILGLTGLVHPDTARYAKIVKDIGLRID